ncbi:MAG: sigma-70 family RNA polymerase sigma factor [Thiobacillus sp.]
MRGTDRTQRFEAAVLPHLDAAYNLARWLLHDEQSAQDVVQEAYLRAFRFFDGFRGGDARPWLLSIVRNSCFTWLRERGRDHLEFDEERDSDQRDPALHEAADGPERLLERKLERTQVNAAITTLPPLFREVLVLREIEALSYEEIAQVVGIPAGTVMSRLSRARSMLRAALAAADKED